MGKTRLSLNQTEIEILKMLPCRKLTVSEASEELSISLSWTSEVTDHLEILGLLTKERVGTHTSVSMPKTPLGESLSVLITEERMLNLETLLANSGLLVLPLLLKPGHTVKELVVKTSLSVRTVKGLLPRWRRMGVVLLENGIYYINPKFRTLIDFLQRYNEHRNISFLKEEHPEAMIVWQWRDEFMIAVDHDIKDQRFSPAALSALDSDLFHTKEYFYHGKDEISLEEALVQALYVYHRNPRVKRYVSSMLTKANIEDTSKFAKKYDMMREVSELI